MKQKISSTVLVLVFMVMITISAYDGRTQHNDANVDEAVQEYGYQPYSGIIKTQYDIFTKYTNGIDINIEKNNVAIVSTAYEEKGDDAVIEAAMGSGGFTPINLNMYTTSPLNIRSAPNANSDVVGYLDINDIVTVVSQEYNSDWVKIEFGGQNAYVNKKYLSDQRTTRVDLGTYMLTGYCSCPLCCGVQTGITASGSVATSSRTIAADKDIPFGTKIEINGHVYTVEDRGGMINDNHIDIYFDTHQEAVDFAVQYQEVFMILD